MYTHNIIIKKREREGEREGNRTKREVDKDPYLSLNHTGTLSTY